MIRDVISIIIDECNCMKSSWEELTMCDYEDIVGIIGSKDDDKVKDAKLLAVLDGCMPQDVWKREYDEVMCMKDKARFLGMPIEVKCCDKFEYGGYVFKTKGITNISYGQYIDIESANGYVDLLRCILIPEGRSYNDGYEVDWGGIPYVIGKGVLEVFMNGLVTFAKRSLGSLRLRMKVLRIMRKSFPSYPEVDSLISDTVCSLSSRKWVI